LVLFFALWTLRATVLIRFDTAIQSPESRTVYATLVKIILWVVPAMVFARWVRKKNPIDYLGLSVLPKTRTWARSFLAIGLFCALVLAFEILVGQKTISLKNPVATGLTAGIAFHFVSPWVEEVFFRGLVLNELSAFMRPALSNLVASILFVGIHLPYWIWSGTTVQEIARNSIGILVFSLFAGWLYFRSKSIWPSTAAHIANNFLSSLIRAG
jgi:membrane protease YdiL (CAAX protease family)